MQAKRIGVFCNTFDVHYLPFAIKIFILSILILSCRFTQVIVLCFVVRYFMSSFAIILMGKRELVALLGLSSWCLMVVVWLFLAVPWVCLQFVIVVFPDHTHLLFFTVITNHFHPSKSQQ